MSHPNETGVATEVRPFTGETQYENFPRWKDTMAVSRMDPADELFEAAVGIRVQEAAARLQQRLGVHAFAIGRVPVLGCRPIGRAPGSLIAHHHP